MTAVLLWALAGVAAGAAAGALGWRLRTAAATERLLDEVDRLTDALVRADAATKRAERGRAGALEAERVTYARAEVAEAACRVATSAAEEHLAVAHQLRLANQGLAGAFAAERAAHAHCHRRQQITEQLLRVVDPSPRSPR